MRAKQGCTPWRQVCISNDWETWRTLEVMVTSPIKARQKADCPDSFPGGILLTAERNALTLGTGCSTAWLRRHGH